MVQHIQNFLLMSLPLFVLIYMNKRKDSLQFHLKSTTLRVVVGVSLGLISTFVGIGGGPINMVALTLFFSLDTKSATVNSLVLILFSQLSKLLNVFLVQGFAAYDLSMLIHMIPAGMIGGISRSTLNKKIERKADYSGI